MLAAAGLIKAIIQIKGMHFKIIIKPAGLWSLTVAEITTYIPRNMALIHDLLWFGTCGPFY